MNVKRLLNILENIFSLLIMPFPPEGSMGTYIIFLIYMAMNFPEILSLCNGATWYIFVNKLVNLLISLMVGPQPTTLLPNL